MFRLASMLYSLISTSLAGVGVIAVPAAWLVAKQIYGTGA